MSAGTIEIKLKINFPVILFAVLFVHALLLVTKSMPHLERMISDAQRQHDPNAPIPLNIREIRTVGSPLSKIKNSSYLSKSDSKEKTISPVKAGEAQNTVLSDLRKAVPAQRARPAQPAKPHHPISLHDLSVPEPKVAQASPPKTQRPGTRPEVVQQEKKAISAISLKGAEIQKFMKDSSSSSSSAAVASSAAQLSGDPRARSLSNSDILVNLEVPEGVNPDELNKYELMFYGFQRRTAINYVNAFYKNLDKFQRENPHLNFPMTEGKQIMTGRLTYDEKGNVKQIKMIRWTNVDRLQNFFEDVLKDMDTLHNPPKPLWSQNGEFSIFFSLVING